VYICSPNKLLLFIVLLYCLDSFSSGPNGTLICILHATSLLQFSSESDGKPRWLLHSAGKWAVLITERKEPNGRKCVALTARSDHYIYSIYK
jgi:hypothetical protein